MTEFSTASTEQIEADGREDPGRARARAEASDEKRRRKVAEMTASGRANPERNVYGRWRRRQARAAGIPVVPMALLGQQTRDPNLVLTRRRTGEFGLVALPVLTASRRALTTTSTRARGAGRPRAQAARSSARSGDSGAGDDGPPEPEPDPAPPAARDKIARCWEALLRERTGLAWRVRP